MRHVVASALAGLLAIGGNAWAQEGAPATEPAAETAAPVEAATTIEWPVPEPVDVICPFAFDYDPGDMTCGFISVPENRDDADSRMIRLHYVKIAATAEDEADVREDPVLYLTGGPGVVVEGYADRLREHDVLLQRDLYILEQRGIANSGDFCPHFEDTHRDLAWADDPIQGAANNAERLRACFETAVAAGVDLSGYSTLENARDVRALRQALGFEQWNVWGISYGSHLGQMVLREDPEGVQAMVIDAIVPNDLIDLMRIGRWVNRVFDNVFSTCVDDAICEGLQPRFEAAMAQLKAEPIIVETDNPEMYPEGQVSFGAEILMFAPFMMMYEQDQHTAIPAVMEGILSAVETGDHTVFELMARSGFDGGGGSSQGMSSAIRCNDGYVAATVEIADEDLAESPLMAGLGFIEGSSYTLEVCEEFGLSPRDRNEAYMLVETDLPVLVVNGAWDPVTPPPLAERIMSGFSNGRYIEVPYAGHGPTRSMEECAGPVLNAFFDNPDPAALDATCLEEGVPQPSYATFYTTSALARAGLLAADDPKTLAPVGAWVGIPLLMLLLSAFVYPLAFAARRIGHRSAEVLAADTSGARWLAWLAALSGLAFPVFLGLGAYEASEISEIALLAGLTQTATIGAWLALLSGVLGLLALIQLWRSHADGGVRIGTLIGVSITGLSAVALAAFSVAWDLSIF